MTDNKPCRGTLNGHPTYWYGKIGNSPCGQFVSHDSNYVCNVIETTTIKESVLTCMCKTEKCPCGDFVSHKVFEPCNGEI